MVAQWIAAHYPEKVKSLTLCATFAKLFAAPDYDVGLRQSALHKMLPLFQDDYPKHMRQFLELQLLHTPKRQAVIEAVLPDVLRNGTPQGMADALTAIEYADMRPLLAGIRCPTLLIFGGKDALTPVRMGQYLQQHLPNARLHIIDKAAHAPFISHSDEVAALLLAHIRQSA